ncbi:unnamed protein product [Eruca vesicaria subsp. sativa]|uniref:CRIB domain-containing protein n=1 Tax=Eruca vesicaria subsp. sativa TaxID=29727 RepID=A0ABC8JI31_ERUVS|nr:unnamed protein product [Eruca vesicaria subsp. sativa]
MKGFLKGLRYIARIFEDEKEPEIQIGNPTDVKHVAHIGWEGPSATTPSWMHEYKSTDAKGSSNKKEKQRNKGRRKSSTNTNNSPAESPSRVGGSTRPSKRSTGKQREQGTGAGLDLTQQKDQSAGQKQSRQKKSKGAKSKETDISVRGDGSSTGR